MKQEKGITLIALVITIIVLLILAGVAIVTLTGDNGILNKAQSAKKNTDESQEFEQIQLAATAAKTNVNYKIDTKILQKELGDIGIEIGDTPTFPLTITGNTGKEYNIEENGKVAQKSIPASDYGARVTNYNVVYDSSENTSDPAKGNIWRVFYDDGEHVYLIADDYARYDDIKNVKRGTNELRGSLGGYSLQFGDVIKDYSGSEWIIQNSKAKKWLSKYLSAESPDTRYSGQCVAYIMDTEIWTNKFISNDNFAESCTEYAIGGPPFEMYCASYKETHPEKYFDYRINFGNSDGWFGYEWRWNSGSWSQPIYDMPRDDYNKIYIKSDREKTQAMYLAAAAPTNSYPVMAYSLGGLWCRIEYWGWIRITSASLFKI